mmetsp:Transcript_15743/g.61489  ORF Transcript_15743/g.61489 Transcript_15743/m.61489 type:complete len:221 (-) Transcript_15743:85-747(-)
MDPPSSAAEERWRGSSQAQVPTCRSVLLLAGREVRRGPPEEGRARRGRRQRRRLVRTGRQAGLPQRCRRPAAGEALEAAVQVLQAAGQAQAEGCRAAGSSAASCRRRPAAGGPAPVPLRRPLPRATRPARGRRGRHRGHAPGRGYGAAGGPRSAGGQAVCRGAVLRVRRPKPRETAAGRHSCAQLRGVRCLSPGEGPRPHSYRHSPLRGPERSALWHPSF